ncbi:hypothetical protein ACVITL_004331 [Rhizobium pisi]
MLGDRRAVARPRLELRPLCAGQEAADIRFVRLRLARGLGGIGHVERQLGDFHFRQRRALGQLLDLLAVFVARAGIENAVVRMLPEQLVDMAHLLDPDRPFGIVDLAKAADDVSHRHIAGGEAAVFGCRRLFGIAAEFFQPLVEPGDRQARSLRAVAQAIEELRRECIVLGKRLQRLQIGSGFRRIAQAHQLVGRFVGAAAQAPAGFDAARNAAKVFHEHIAHERGQCPEFADPERLVGLKTVDQRRQALLRDCAVGMGDVEPGKHERARHLDAADGHRRQFAVEAAGEVAPDFLDRFFDDIMIIEQPFRRRRDGLAGLDVRGRGAVDAQDFLLVFLMAREEIEGGESRQPVDAVAGDDIAHRLDVFDGKVGRADRIVVIDLLRIGFARKARRRIGNGHGFGSGSKQSYGCFAQPFALLIMTAT